MTIVSPSLLLTTYAEYETIELGALIGGYLVPGDFVGLIGELGTGKTTLVKGIARGMDVSGQAYVRSPTFTLLHTYQGRCPVFHLDCYRINDPREIEALDYRALFYGDGVTVVEWAEKILSYFPDSHLKISLSHVDETTRDICLQPAGDRLRGVVEDIARTIRAKGRHRHWVNAFSFHE